MAGTFEREYELYGGLGVLVFSQLKEGDVNCVVWDAALVLAKYIEIAANKNPEWLHNKRVVELGAGLGCVGLVAACCGGSVVLTDQPKALPLLEHNIGINRNTLEMLKCTITAKSLDWNDDIAEEPCDILLMADCVYYKESIDPLIKVMLRLTTEKSEVILCQEDRSYSDIQKDVWDQFQTKVIAFFNITEIPSENQHPEFNSADIRLLLMKKKPSL